ncbi:MAG TPA: hypothetical protein VF410_05025 [Rhizomicrobium sp.]
MIIGLSVATFTLVHVAITLIAILSGLAVLFGLLRSRRMDGLTDIFLIFTVLTDVTGFMFPFHGLTPAFNLGIISSVVLIPTLVARYAFAMTGWWRGTYVIGAVLSLYFNCFVLVVQAFQKVPALHALAPKGNEPPFAIAQGLGLLFFIVTGFLASRRFRLTA